jgi:hypothetical protein
MLVLELLSAISWHSEDGFDVTLKSLESFRERKKFRYFFEPFLRVLEESKNIILIGTVCSFLNSIIEASS